MNDNFEEKRNEIESYLLELKSFEDLKEKLNNLDTDSLRYDRSISADEYNKVFEAEKFLEKNVKWYENKIEKDYFRLKELFLSSSDELQELINRRDDIAKSMITGPKVQNVDSGNPLSSRDSSEIIQYEMDALNRKIEALEMNIIDIKKPLSKLVNEVKSLRFEGKVLSNPNGSKYKEAMNMVDKYSAVVNEEEYELTMEDAKRVIEINNKAKNNELTNEELALSKKYIEDLANKLGISGEELLERAKGMVNSNNLDNSKKGNDSNQIGIDPVKTAAFLSKTDVAELNDEEKDYVVKVCGLNSPNELTNEHLAFAQQKLIEPRKNDNKNDNDNSKSSSDLGHNTEKMADFLAKTDPANLTPEEKDYVVNTCGLNNPGEITKDTLASAQQNLSSAGNERPKRVTKISTATQNLKDKAVNKLRSIGNKSKIIASLVAIGVGVAALLTAGASLGLTVPATVAMAGAGALGGSAVSNFNKGRSL